ncbi:NEL-type E3 ubiquitin ligase domain-containing protein [Pseudomonas syringae group genomosp. 3]|uniref:RING-type E3 ubiquitin transferase n=1 Tax=Pseudomonas syringae pv. primulae TaxID=251707 RepID=A0A3M4SCJ2_9PSED|nr:NEL-type E3 ubiquitin ligase domain-containing protein [Pseudomonas syringae group genomosp. 3]RMR12631.1 Leucine-rich repeat protein [Pseudomonas syringae pv. primulae]
MLDPSLVSNAPANPHVQLIEDHSPDWLLEAEPATHAALRKASAVAPQWLASARESSPEQVAALQRLYAEHRDNEQKVRPTLDRLSTLEDFARPLLTAAIKERFGLDVDVDQTWLFHAGRAKVDQSFISASKDPMTQANIALRAATQSLLKAALQNFEAWETASGAMDSDFGIKAAVLSAYKIIGTQMTGKSVPISPTGFAALCRELDLGDKYQTHLESAFSTSATPGETADRIRDNFIQLESSSIRLQLQIATLKGLISQPLNDAVLDIVAGKRNVQLDNLPVKCSVLRLWDVELTGIVVFGKDREMATQVEKIVVYIPDDPIAPLKEYDSAEAFLSSLRDRMFVDGYLNFFQRFIPARHRSALYGKLLERLHPKVKKGGFFEGQWLEQQADRSARLDLRETLLGGVLLDNLHDRKRAALRDDALFHGVPTAAEDQKTFDERVQYFKDTAFNVLNIAAFVVPGLGEVMLAVTAAQLIHEVYDGVQSWAHGERQQAFAYLFDVVENIALMLALGAAVASGSGIPAVQVPEFVSRLKPVELPDGATRLWKPDLSPFAHDIVLPKGLQPDELGLYHWQGKQWLPVDGQTYSVKPAATDGDYLIEHPTRTNSYQPALRHNGTGAWLHELDRPLEMEGLTLFRRLGYSNEAFSDVTARRILRVSDTTESVMRRALHEQQPAPALLEDTARRFRLDQQIDRVIKQMEAGDIHADASLQLDLLSQEPAWPGNRTLLLVDGDGNTLGTFPPARQATPDNVLRIRAYQPDALRQALEGLSNNEIRTLLDEEFGAGQLGMSPRLTTLRTRLVASARRSRAWLFESRYRTLKIGDVDGTPTLQKAFGGLPPMVAQELASHASPAERVQLVKDHRVPLQMAEEATAYLQKTRLARAYEGLYLTSVSSTDSECLALHSLEALPKWPAEVRLEIRNRYFSGALIDSIGPQDAPIRKVLISDGSRYEVRDADDQHLHGLDDLYSSVLHALPDAQRSQLGFPHAGQGQDLKRLVQENPLSRQKLAPLLKMQAIKPGSRSPMRLADGRLGYPLSGRGSVDWHVTDESLLDKIRTLELEDAFPEDILNRLRHTGRDNRAIDDRLNTLLGEQLDLRASLAVWTDEVVTFPQMSQAHVDSRERISEAIWSHWRLNNLPEIGRTFEPLRLQYLSLTDFPRHLPDFFCRQVRYLYLSRVTGTASDLDQLLRRMTDLRSLEMSGHVIPLTQLPEALVELRALRSLCLNDQGLLLEQQHIDFLSRIPTLEHLELDGNRIGAINDLTGLNHTALNWLSLSNAGLSEWPTWVDEMIPSPLKTLLLEGNLITDLPENILANPVSQHSHTEISLLNNPLSEATIRSAQMSERHGHAFTFDMDLPPELSGMDLTESHDTDGSISDYMSSEDSRSSTPEPVSAEPWLEETDQRSAERRQIWEQLEAGEHTRNLLDLIGSLRQSADYRNLASRPALQERVWGVLATANQDPQLRMTLNAIAEEPLRLLRDNETCPDGIFLEFNQMEVLVFTRQSLQNVVQEQRGNMLYRLTVRLYRLSELDAAAREQAGDRDEAEVRLAYRMHWGSALDLPVQPGNMLFEVHARIRPGELDTALLRVQTGEQGEPFLRYAAQQDFWVSYLRENHASRFDALERIYRTDLTRLTDEFEQRNISLDNPEYESRIQEFEARCKQQQATLIRELTSTEGLEHTLDRALSR